MIGTQLGKTYQIIDKIDEGGMGVVYQVEHQTLRKRFAAKVLSAQLADNDEARRRFEIEAHAASKLDHENIVNVTDYGVADDGRPYLVMELLRGKTLYQRMADGPVSLDEAIAIIVPVCRALEAAHGEGFIHRDVKPENIFLTQRPGGRFGVKVLDFGITKIRADAPRLTKMGQALGSPLYMSPETCRGEPSDHRADIYSVGVLLYQLVCGELPFYDENVLRVIQLHASQPLRPPKSLRPDIPDALDLVIRKALAKDPDTRHQTIEQLEGELLAALPPGADGLLHARRTPLSMPVSSPPPIATPQPAPAAPPEPSTTLSTRRSKRLPILLLALLLLGGGAVGGWVYTRRGEGGGSSAKAAPPAAAPQAEVPAADTPPAPLTIRVDVKTRPEGAVVALDGVELGKTPLAIDIAGRQGLGKLSISADGHQPAERQVALDRDVALALSLDPMKRRTKPVARTRPARPAPKPPAPKPDEKLDIRGAR